MFACRRVTTQCPKQLQAQEVSSDPAAVLVVTKMFRAGLMKLHNDCCKDVSEVDKQIATFPGMFAISRSSFSSNLLTKATKNRANASQILHFVFSVPRGSAQIPPADREHVDAVHAMLHLANGQGLLDVTHPLSQEHGATTNEFVLGKGHRTGLPLRG